MSVKTDASRQITEGVIWKQLLIFFFPIMLGSFFQQLYNTVDTVVVGQFVGKEALAAVGGSSAQIASLIVGFFTGLSSGASVIIAHFFGARDRRSASKAVHNAYVLAVAGGIVLTVLGVLLTPHMLSLMNTPEATMGDAVLYLRIYFGALTFTFIYNMGASILRAAGNSRTPLYFLVAAAVLNVGLDFAFIMGCGWHYCGAALATVLSQLLSGGACLAYALYRYPVLRPARSDFGWDTRLAMGHFAVGLPMALQFSITAIGCIVQQTALNGLDAALPGAVTAYTAASKIDNIANQAFAALGTAFATYAAQNYGAGEYGRIRRGVFVGMVYVLASAAIGFAFAVGLCEPLMKLFLNTDLSADVADNYDAIIGYGRQYLLWQCAFYPFLGAIFVFRNTLQGIGKSAVTTFAGVTELAGRILASRVFVRIWGFAGICSSNPVAWVAAVLFLVTTYIVVMRRQAKGEIPDGRTRSHRRRLRRSCRIAVRKAS